MRIDSVGLRIISKLVLEKYIKRLPELLNIKLLPLEVVLGKDDIACNFTRG